MSVWRWLTNRWIKPRPLYKPFIRKSLRQWRGQSAPLGMETIFTDRKRWQMVWVDVIPYFRTVPV